MSKVIPINAVRTTEEWLLSAGFQKLKTRDHGVFLFKKGELYIQGYLSNVKRRPDWYRVNPMADGTVFYSGTGNIGYACEFTYQVEQHYRNIHDAELIS